jgi:hypothetical protein
MKKGGLHEELIYEDGEYLIRKFVIVDFLGNELSESWVVDNKITGVIKNEYKKPDALIRSQKLKQLI